jgi:hypothetical protein
LTASTLVTLVLVPVSYVVVSELRIRLTRHRGPQPTALADEHAAAS